MRTFAATFASLALLLIGAPAFAQDYADNGLYDDGAFETGLYDNEVGYNDGDEGYSFDFGGEGNFETAYGTDDNGWFDEGLYGDEWENDNYGYYDTNYDWNTDDEWFDGWYGESDDGWF